MAHERNSMAHERAPTAGERWRHAAAGGDAKRGGGEGDVLKSRSANVFCVPAQYVTVCY